MNPLRYGPWVPSTHVQDCQNKNSNKTDTTNCITSATTHVPVWVISEEQITNEAQILAADWLVCHTPIAFMIVEECMCLACVGWTVEVRDLSGMTSVVFINTAQTWVLLTTHFHGNVQWSVSCLQTLHRVQFILGQTTQKVGVKFSHFMDQIGKIHWENWQNC